MTVPVPSEGHGTENDETPPTTAGLYLPEHTNAPDPRSSEGHGRDREEEVEAVARAMWPSYTTFYGSHRRMAADVIAALDRVRAGRAVSDLDPAAVEAAETTWLIRVCDHGYRVEWGNGVGAWIHMDAPVRDQGICSSDVEKQEVVSVARAAQPQVPFGEGGHVQADEAEARAAQPSGEEPSSALAWREAVAEAVRAESMAVADAHSWRARTERAEADLATAREAADALAKGVTDAGARADAAVARAERAEAFLERLAEAATVGEAALEWVAEYEGGPDAVDADTDVRSLREALAAVREHTETKEQG